MQWQALERDEARMRLGAAVLDLAVAPAIGQLGIAPSVMLCAVWCVRVVDGEPNAVDGGLALPLLSFIPGLLAVVAIDCAPGAVCRRCR